MHYGLVTHFNVGIFRPINTGWRNSSSSNERTGVASMWSRPESTLHASWVGCFCTLFSKVFHRVLRFFLLIKTQHFQTRSRRRGSTSSTCSQPKLSLNKRYEIWVSIPIEMICDITSIASKNARQTKHACVMFRKKKRFLLKNSDEQIKKHKPLWQKYKNTYHVPGHLSAFLGFPKQPDA